MDEAKKLKEKFDAIFGTTEYNKAIDKFIKIRKKFEDDLKLCANEKRVMEGYKNTADKKSLELDLLKKKHENMEKSTQELDVKIKAIEKELEVLMNKEMEYGKSYQEKSKLETTISNYEKNAESLRGKIKNLMKDNIPELEEKLQSFLETQLENEKLLKKLNGEWQKLSDEEKKTEKSVIEAKSNLNVLATKLGEKQELISKRFSAIKSLCKQLNIPVDLEEDSQSMSDDALDSFIHRIQNGIVEKEASLTKIKANADKQELEFQQQIDNVREEKTTAETNVVTQKSRISKLDNDIRELRNEISSIETSMPKFIQLQERIATMEKKLQQIKDQNNIEDMEDERSMVEAEKLELEVKQTSLEEVVDKLESISQVTNELDMKQADLTKDQNDFERLKNKQSSILKHLFPSKAVDRNYKNTVQSYNDSLKSEVQVIKSALEEARMSGNRISAERDQNRKQLKQREMELREIKEKIDRICDGRDYKDFLSSQKEKVDKLNMDLAFHKSSEASFKHYLRDIQQDPCCPLCHKNLQGNESDDLNGKLRWNIFVILHYIFLHPF